MKKFGLLISFLLLTTQLVLGQSLLVDDFTGTLSTNLTANGWVAHSGAGTTPMTIASPGLTYLGYLSSGVGNATSASGTGEDVNKAFTSTTSGSVYYSFMVNANPTTTTGDYSVHFCQSSGSSAAGFFGRFFIQKDATTNLRFGLSKATTSASFTGYSYAMNTTYLIVVKYTFNTGTTTDDGVYMWVNPTPGTTEPTPTISIPTEASTDAVGLAAIALRQWNAGTLARFDGIRVGTTWASVTPATGTPAILITPNSLSDFNYVVGSGPSTSQSYSLSGSDLTGYPGNITVTGSTNYEVSTDNSTFGSSVTVPYTSATLTSTPIYVRLKTGLIVGTYNGETISNAGGGATTQNVTCSGEVYNVEPTDHAADFTAALGTPAHSAIIVTWTDATETTVPDGYLIKGSDEGYGSITEPADGTPEVNSTLVRNVTQGIETYTFTGLSASTTYYFKIYPYTNSGTGIDYKTDGTVPQDDVTTDVAPALPNLLFSEYVEGSSNNKALEIINLTENTVDLSTDNYIVEIYFNGASTVGNTIALTGSILDSSVYVLVNSSADPTLLLPLADQVSGSLTFNGDDAIVLKKGGSAGDILDIIGQVGNDPGDFWGTAPITTQNYTLRRKGTVTIGDRNGTDTFDPASEWDSYDIDTFSGLGDPAPLPVELSSFSASVIGSTVKLNWRTETEVNNYGFEILRQGHTSTSLSVTDWEKIGFVEGYGNSNSPKDYSFTDASVLSGTYSYRLKQIDIDGQFEYSKIIEVNLGSPKKYELAQNFPNPFNPNTSIKFTLPETGNVKLTVYNMLGQEIAILVNGVKEAGTHIINFNAEEFNSGVYIYRIESNGFNEVRKMTLIK